MSYSYWELNAIQIESQSRFSRSTCYSGRVWTKSFSTCQTCTRTHRYTRRDRRVNSSICWRRAPDRSRPPLGLGLSVQPAIRPYIFPSFPVRNRSPQLKQYQSFMCSYTKQHMKDAWRTRWMKVGPQRKRIIQQDKHQGLLGTWFDD